MVTLSYGIKDVKGAEMNIQAINSANAMLSCQPIKQVEFAKRPTPTIIEDPVSPEDTLEIENPSTLEQKYDLACRLAAYYKGQYETLLSEGSIVA